MRRLVGFACTCVVLAVLACDEGLADAPPPVLLPVELTDEFQTTADFLFTRITALAFAPNGHLAVVDTEERTVTVLDHTGQEVGQWGGRGDGPGEFSHTLGNIAISDRGVVAIDNSRRVDLFTLAGEMVGTHSTFGSVFALAFDGEGNVLAKTRHMDSPTAFTSQIAEQVIRLDDGEVLWTSEPLPSLGMIQVFPPRAVLADLGGGRIAVGVSDRYDLTVLDASTAKRIGRISRDVPIRGPSEEYIEEYRSSLIGVNEEEVPEDFVKGLIFADVFPVVREVFTGPPSGTVWVRRGGGVGDALAGDPGDLEKPLLYDLFASGSYEYLGTVAVPDRVRLMAGDSTRVAGVQVDALGVPSVRVLRAGLLPASPVSTLGSSPNDRH